MGENNGNAPEMDGAQIVWRCVVCGRRFCDVEPPIGAAECVCERCKAVNTLSIMPADPTTTIAAWAGYSVMWIIRRGVRFETGM